MSFESRREEEEEEEEEERRRRNKAESKNTTFCNPLLTKCLLVLSSTLFSFSLSY